MRKQMKNDLQICLFSATVPAWVRDIAAQHMKRGHANVDLAQDLSNKSNKNI
jgi:superfamily II DNA/RNA helicase